MCNSVIPMERASFAFCTMSGTASSKPLASRFFRENAQNWQLRMQ